jgi:hypothetical protein
MLKRGLLKMPKTTVSKHPRKGTRGVKKHYRLVPTQLKVPHDIDETLIFSGNIEGQKFRTYIMYKGKKINNLIVHDLTPIKDRVKGLYDRVDLEVYEIQLPNKTVFISSYNSYINTLTGLASYSGKHSGEFNSFREARSWLRKETKTKVKDMDFTTTYTPQKDGVERFRSIPRFLQFEHIR